MTPIRTAMVLGAAMMIAAAAGSASAEDSVWPDIQRDVFQSRPVAEKDGTIALYAPESAEDAAIVPIAIHLPPAVANRAKSLTLVIDRNPAPVAATFRFGEGFRASPDIGERKLQTRVRVDSFSNVRAILETDDGKLHMATAFVRGAGGCSAPASKDMDEALASLGKMQVKAVANPAMDKSWREGIVMIRHPNFTGMQMDPISRGYTPARFISNMSVKRGGALVLSMQGGISISEDPNVRFNYDAASDDTLDVQAADTDGAKFNGRSTPSGS